VVGGKNYKHKAPSASTLRTNTRSYLWTHTLHQVIHVETHYVKGFDLPVQPSEGLCT